MLNRNTAASALIVPADKVVKRGHGMLFKRRSAAPSAFRASDLAHDFARDQEMKEAKEEAFLRSWHL